MRPSNRGRSDSEDSESSLSFDLQKEYAAKQQEIIRRRMDQSKKSALQEKKKQKQKQKMEDELLRVKLEQTVGKTAGNKLYRIPQRQNQQEKDGVFYEPQQLGWYIYPKCPELDILNRVPRPMNKLPIFRKKDQIMDAITKNQFVLVTGETGCGKSTQVPRLIYEYLRMIGDTKSRIMCVQPRRIAVMNLHSILDRQMMERDRIGYQIGMKSEISHSNRIVFVTNGIFLQRLVHSTEFFNEYPFIVLDQVHERDIDTDFILLTIKRVIRLYPKVRIILMSATIDNHLFKYYFASDHVDKILKEKNYYMRIEEAKQMQKIQKNQRRRMRRSNDDEDQEESQSNSEEEEDRLQRKYGFGFLNSKYPCPSINVTEPGKFTRQYFYLDTMKKFLPSNIMNNSWGGVIFSDKYPSTNRELYQSVSLIIDQLVKKNRDVKQKSSVLIFMPGLAQIEQLSEFIRDFFRSENVNKYMEILNVHSSILNDQISKKLLEKQGSKHKIIIATNIAESSITVLGVQYVIDFCLSKEVRFDQRSRMENLELVWASKASCNQRAGRTGRVCNGIIFRMVEKKFYDNLKDYSEPEIQRSSLDKLILRIKLLHEGQENTKIFQDPGEVLGSAIQPPKLKNIDTAIKSLKFSGGLEQGKQEGQFNLTNLGRLYIDIPIDITYCKLLVVSQIFGTFYDMLNLVSILSQSKNVIRRGTIDRNYKKFYEACSTPYNCDFLGLLLLFENGRKNNNAYKKDPREDVYLDVYGEILDMRRDIQRRISRKKQLFPLLEYQQKRKWNLRDFRKDFNKQMEDYLLRFKMTLICGFINNMLVVRQETLTDKQQKRLALMKRVGIPHENTVCLLNAKYLKKPSSGQAERRLKEIWTQHISASCNIPRFKMDFTLTLGLTYLHFQDEQDLHKFLYFRAIEESKKLPYDPDMANPVTKSFVSIQQIVSSFGEMDHMHAGRVMTFQKDQTVTVDSYSLNRVINLNQGAEPKYIITNNISKQSSRMKARFTSQLPQKARHLQALSQLLFYPFVRLSTTFQKSRYNFILLGKSKKGKLPKTKVPIRFMLTNKDIKQANGIRILLRQYFSLKDRECIEFRSLWMRIQSFLFAERQDIVESEKWQQLYINNLLKERPQLETTIMQLSEYQSDDNFMVAEGEEDMVFMNQIRPFSLKCNFFSDIVIAGMSRQQREKEYNNWKLNKLREVREIESRVYDHNSYLACGQKSCAMKICPMVKVGPTNQMIYRQLFGYIPENVKQMPFSVSDPNHFCNMLQSNYLEWQFSTWACANGHYFAIKFEHENKLRIVPFSQLLIIYPDGSSERADFKNLDIKHWKKTHDKKLQDKYKISISTYCFVCDQIMTTFKNLEQHIRDTKHTDNMREFMRTLPQEMQDKPKVVKNTEEDNNSMY